MRLSPEAVLESSAGACCRSPTYCRAPRGIACLDGASRAIGAAWHRSAGAAPRGRWRAPCPGSAARPI
eukprot:11718930-Alexandrium_andersonii.AAC.1